MSKRRVNRKDHHWKSFVSVVAELALPAIANRHLSTSTTIVIVRSHTSEVQMVQRESRHSCQAHDGHQHLPDTCRTC